MRYMLMMNTPGGGNRDYQINNWSPDDFKAHIAFMHEINRKLQSTGERVDAQGLASPSEAKLVRARSNGTPATDGVFPESKEFLAGFWIIDVDRPERAFEIAAEISAAPGPGGVPMNMPIEVRQVMSGPPEA